LLHNNPNLNKANGSGAANPFRLGRNDYSPHREPFQYYPSTANPTHIRPASVTAIGKDGDKTNHQYDLHDFVDAVKAGNMPTVSFLKPRTIQSGHSGESDPLDEQDFLVNTINFIEKSKFWDSTAIVVTYDDSDGWCDHQASAIVNSSTGVADFLNGTGVCGNQEHILPGIDSYNEHATARCGHGPRLPLLIISPWAKTNFVDHTLTDQTSIIRFVEDNWLKEERIGQGSFDELAGSIENMFDFEDVERAQKCERLILNPQTGVVTSCAERDHPQVRTVVHLHGGRVPAESDGYPESWYPPGKTASYSYPNRQDAAMLWYHDHAMGIERLNVYAGLFGAYLIRDSDEDGLNLPRGKYEIPLLLCDRMLRQDGQLYYPISLNPVSMLVNGSRWQEPVTETTRQGSVEIWQLVNLTPDTHPIHLHQVRFQVLDRQPILVPAYLSSRTLSFRGPAVAPAANEAGWKDTVRVEARGVTRIIVRFDGYSGRFVWHCHSLEHAANEMMRPYEIISG
jgi:hypothetical protein